MPLPLDSPVGDSGTRITLSSSTSDGNVLSDFHAKMFSTDPMGGLSIAIGRLLFNHAGWLHKPLYRAYKTWHDRFELRVLRRLIHKEDVVVDIGANLGFYTRFFSEQVGPGGKVLAFEPDTENFRRLVEGTEWYSNVVLRREAVSNVSGPLNIYRSKLSNVDHRTYPTEEYESTYEIKAVALDDFISSDDRIDFIKMDIQGYEYHALRGMKGILKTQKPLLFMELWPDGLKGAGSDAREVLAFLRGFGFSLYVQAEEYVQPFPDAHVHTLEGKGVYGFVNILACKDNRVEQLPEYLARS
ncbi:MAG: FkbM family methyltransferase [Ignavibacteriales bacterium]|nr:FkbM family methyltransferase [Ignavibacteriales bacterium]